MTSQLVVGPLLGYRWWRLDRDGDRPVLRSLYNATLWPAEGPLRASCNAASHQLTAWIRSLFSRTTPHHAAPAWGCQCGIYALARLDEADAFEASPRPGPGSGAEPWQVVGVVLLWGRVIQHEQGYRAEYARPLRLLAAPESRRGDGHHRLIEAVARRYAIEVVSDTARLTRR